MSLKGAFLGPALCCHLRGMVCVWVAGGLWAGGGGRGGGSPQSSCARGYPRVGETMPKWGKILKSLKEIVVYESVNEAGITSANTTQRSRSPGWPELPKGCSEPRGRLVVPA